MLRLLRTTSFRFTLIYVVLFAGAVALLGAYLYTATFGDAAKETDRVIDTEIGVLAELFSTSGSGMLTRVIRQRTAWSDDAIYMLIGAPSGAVLAGNLTALPPEALQAEGDFFNFKFEKPLVDAAGREVGVQQREARGKMMRFRASPEAEQSFLVVVARDIASREYLRSRTQAVITRAALVTVALGVVIGLVFSRTLLGRVEVVNKTARAIRGGDLSQRIPLTGSGDELDDLSANLNSMLDQIERLMAGMRDVSDNIAHDLRSPLTRIRNRLTNALEGDDAAKDAALRATIDDSEKLLATFNALLSIARIQSGEGAGALKPIDIVAIAEEMAELYEPAAQDAGFELELVTAPTPLVKGSRELVSQAVANFLDNALKYAEGGTRIVLKVGRAKNGGAVFSVADNGPGVAPEDRERIFERFVRLEASRSTPGSGLGLSLVSAIARAHGATIELTDGIKHENDQGCGLGVVMTFPPSD
ncbi:sensor histidine kinase [Hyphococcus luteus]|uniref:histidine kinase n=1 Tax=Hyphococcus luteus TaxID=2058213 RepID=A0A2S7K438_9PROT|nr:HAMP domain-containing sensor histidine kinase [Marinicaulis flavus]PQA87259.1 two-component sensor histidine kinase [Marinicaulis flavus]